MADLGSQKIGSNYQKLLQISESGVVADGSGSYTVLAKALDYAIEVKPDVVSMSLGGSAPCRSTPYQCRRC